MFNIGDYVFYFGSNSKSLKIVSFGKNIFNEEICVLENNFTFHSSWLKLDHIKNRKIKLQKIKNENH